MKIRTVASLGFAVATGIVTTFTRAGDDPAQREQAAIARISLANIVSEQDGRFASRPT